jgi:hypothetical protein
MPPELGVYGRPVALCRSKLPDSSDVWLRLAPQGNSLELLAQRRARYPGDDLVAISC